MSTRPSRTNRSGGTGESRILPRHEPTAWLRAAMRRRVNDIRALGVNTEGYGIVVAPLGRTGGRWERTCDRCGRYCPPGDDFHVLIPPPLDGVTLLCGFCGHCAGLEGAS